MTVKVIATVLAPDASSVLAARVSKTIGTFSTNFALL